MLNEQTTVNTREMVRYTKTENGQRKNTLFTFRNGDNVFFGVSRCRLGTDKFNRELGLHIAKERSLKALKAEQEGEQFIVNDHVSFLSKSGEESPTKGKVSLKNIQSLITWFKQFS